MSDVSLPQGWTVSGKQMVCANPNCKYRGAAAEQAKGSRVALWALMCLFLVPGLIYAIACSGNRYCCPKCGTVANLA